MPSFFHEPQLSDISATLGGVQLPLHTQVLAVRVGACLAAVTSGLELEGADARPAKVCVWWVGGWQWRGAGVGVGAVVVVVVGGVCVGGVL